MLTGLDWGMILLSLGVGGALGFLYFGGLWMTLQRLSHTTRPGLLLLTSFVLRIALLLPLLLWLTAGQFDRLIAATAGVLIMRKLLASRWGLDRRG